MYEKILIFGSTYITQKVVEHLLSRYFNIVGYVPSLVTSFPGKMPVEIREPNYPHDIKLSIQYDQKIEDTDNAFNLHTGLLPDYGGCNILYHTIENGELEQGLTFHRMTEKFDEGPIIAKIVYPVLATDTIVDLYDKVATLAPKFTELCLGLLNWQGHTIKPRFYYRSDIDLATSTKNVADIRKMLYGEKR